jgi:hypothetical protein
VSTRSFAGFSLKSPPAFLALENLSGLVSLAEIMELFNIWEHHNAYVRLAAAIRSLEMYSEQNKGDLPPSDDAKRQCSEILSRMDEECVRIELSSAVRDLISFTLWEIEKGTGATSTITKLHSRISDINFLFRTQCDKVKFFRLNNEESAMVDNALLFGPKVAAAFPSQEATYEIQETGSCLALGRNTAAVFHLMRVLEKGLR